jgi:hypothetical protein
MTIVFAPHRGGFQMSRTGTFLNRVADGPALACGKDRENAKVKGERK